MALAIWAAAAHCGAYATTQDLEHLVRPGDTLEALSVRYLDTPRLWPQLQAHNHVADPRRLRPGSVLRIPAQLLPAGSAQVDFVHGQASATPPAGAGAAPLQPGQSLDEGARLQVAPDSFVTVRLADGTLIRVQADTDLQLQQLRRRGRAGDAQSVLELRRGSVESSVPPSRDGARRFQVRTPKASTSVRGTRFAVTLTQDERTLAAVTAGALSVEPRLAASPMAATLLDAGHGVVVAADGRVGTPRALLPAPDLSGLPASVHDADFLTLALAPVASAVAYQVQVARDADFTETLRSGTFGAPQVRLPALEDGSYHLSVRAVDDSGLPGKVAQRMLTIKAHPVAPLYQSPAPGGTVSRTQGELLCTPVAGVARYRIQVAADAGFAAPMLDETSAQQCSTPVAALAPGQYYWRAASVRELPGGASDQGPYAPGQPFTVANNPSAPSAAALQSGGDGPGLQLRWPGEPGQSYRLQVSATDDFATPLVDERLDTPAWASTSLAPGAYFVRIQTRDPSGLESGFSTPRLLRVQAAVQTQSGLPVTSSDGQPLSRP
ncbi:FecR domain-containing protein [Alicycliphilus denitrificans]|uniref:LysM peptidoglycan-binding domain-containing protein n=1 Tax=Alicycliphilus denitrificans TaxID=179636 RepID=A0A3R7EDQ1_9BURK|nr:FecR domain-containing protein [Alicycliphilus denitrificans]RKJ96457.1 LysM peptidoglycan-binding domain-containing protein [Alicycliphilus denitrificans]